MSIGLVVTAGFGNGTLVGSIADVMTRGYTIGEEVALTADYSVFATDRKIKTIAHAKKMTVSSRGRKIWLG